MIYISVINLNIAIAIFCLQSANHIAQAVRDRGGKSLQVQAETDKVKSYFHTSKMDAGGKNG